MRMEWKEEGLKTVGVEGKEQGSLEVPREPPSVTEMVEEEGGKETGIAPIALPQGRSCTLQSIYSE